VPPADELPGWIALLMGDPLTLYIADPGGKSTLFQWWNVALRETRRSSSTVF
jgi:hypothetical protein